MCNKLVNIPLQSRFIDMERDLLAETVGEQKFKNRERRRKIIFQFLENVNALKNEGGGCVFVHADNPHLLGLFDEQVDDKLKQMITDDSFFHDNFERHMSDKKHIIYRVVRICPYLSTFSFNSKVSLNKGLDEPTHYQMRQLLNTVSNRASKSSSAATSTGTRFKFRLNEEVTTPMCVFSEDVSTQAKSIPLDKMPYRGGIQRQTANAEIQQLADYMWKQVSLPHYITAFSKLKDGGSVYFGLKEKKTEVVQQWKYTGKEIKGVLKIVDENWKIWEDKTNKYVVKKGTSVPEIPGREYEQRPRKWESVDPDTVKHLFSVSDPAWTVWKDEEDTKSVFYLAKESDVPVLKECKTGEFICTGVCLSSDQQHALREEILRRVQTEMLWLSKSRIQDPLDVLYRPVDNGGVDVCVIEVAVKMLDGICFYDKDGPVAYRFKPGLEKVDITKWVTNQKGTIIRQTPVFSSHRR
ncbi:hypothetical protein BaRGS_00032600 [Batillaria attramentaria]|uniref:Schlafen AlbA-2 domain-containing protein n=1 Tax=Batillaria attramentaria TaxID=370345 RepID=A0ABD0JNA1_9CAEN